MIDHVFDLAIIGAGPSGLAAAKEAASLGLETIVLEMRPEPGGHFYNLPAIGFQLDAPAVDVTEGISLVHAAVQAGAQIWCNTTVWGLYPESPFRLCLSGNPTAQLRARRVIAAPGASERTFPFPGWTLPGVMTVGGALCLLKNQCILPGRRFLLAGSGPLQLTAASHLIKAGGDITAIVELNSLPAIISGWRYAGAMLHQSERLREGRGYLNTVWSKKIPYRLGWVITEVRGEECVEEAVIARVDRRGALIAGSHQVLAVDTVCLGYGLVPFTRFSSIMECEQYFHPDLNVYVPRRNTWLESSVKGFYPIGDAVEAAGKKAALLEGQIAALGAAIELHALDETEGLRRALPLKKQLENEYRFAHVLAQMFGLLPGLTDLAREDTIICRCEKVTLAQIKQSVSDGASSVQGVKMSTRAGMGLCQGTLCGNSIGNIIARRNGSHLEKAIQHSARPPVYPVALEELVNPEEKLWTK